MKTLKKLKSTLNCSIRFIYNISDRNEDLLSERIHFKVCVLAYKVVNGIAPDYLCDLVVIDKHGSDSMIRLKVPRLSKTRF